MSTLCPAASPASATLRIASPHQLRVRWGRVATLAVAVAVLTWLLAGLTATTSSADAPPAAPVTIVVEPGDTLWDLSREHAPAGVGTLEYAVQVEAHNDVRAGLLLPGTPIELPQR